MKKKEASIASIFILWFLLIYFIPNAINAYIGSKAENMKPVYELEMEKLRIVMKFERKVIERVGRLKAN